MWLWRIGAGPESTNNEKSRRLADTFFSFHLWVDPRLNENVELREWQPVFFPKRLSRGGPTLAQSGAREGARRATDVTWTSRQYTYALASPYHHQQPPAQAARQSGGTGRWGRQARDVPTDRPAATTQQERIRRTHRPPPAAIAAAALLLALARRGRSTTAATGMSRHHHHHSRRGLAGAAYTPNAPGGGKSSGSNGGGGGRPRPLSPQSEGALPPP